VHAELAAQGIHVGRKRVARLMRAAHVQGVSRRKPFVTTRRDPTASPAPDLVDRQFQVSAPNRLWVADITYIPTAAGFLFLAVVLDAWSRRVVGWAIATHLRTELVMDALNMALRARRPRQVIFRVRVAYIGPKWGSAPTTSWPRPSRQRATPSLSVEASSRIRPRGRGPSTAAKRSRSVRMRCSMRSPPSAKIPATRAARPGTRP
jgi:transposase InsO family protein